MKEKFFNAVNYFTSLVIKIFLFLTFVHIKCLCFIFDKIIAYKNLERNYFWAMERALSKELGQNDTENLNDEVLNHPRIKEMHERSLANTRALKQTNRVGLIKHAKLPEVKESIPVSIEEGDGIENERVINTLIEKSKKEKALPFIEIKGLLNKKDIENAINELDAAIDNEVFKMIDNTKVSLETAAKSLAANKKLKNSAPKPKKKPKSSQKTKKVAKNKRNTYKKK